VIRTKPPDRALLVRFGVRRDHPDAVAQRRVQRRYEYGEFGVGGVARVQYGADDGQESGGGLEGVGVGERVEDTAGAGDGVGLLAGGGVDAEAAEPGGRSYGGLQGDVVLAHGRQNGGTATFTLEAQVAFPRGDVGADEGHAVDENDRRARLGRGRCAGGGGCFGAVRSGGRQEETQDRGQ
jgi:hypothetical protein